MSSNEPLVSVYVPTYNQEKYLRDCLDGIVMQKTNFRFEAIVIDDASTDSNPQIIKEYAERYPEIIKPVLLDENYWSQGINKFFAIFLPKAKGKYIAFCEGDDYWTYDGKLQHQVDFMESHSDYSMCFHNHKVRHDTISKNTRYYYHNLTKNQDVQIEHLLLSDLIQTATILCRKYPDEVSLQSLSEKSKNGFYDLIYFALKFNYGEVYGFSSTWSVYRKCYSSVTENVEREKLDKIYTEQLDIILDIFGKKNKRIEKIVKIGKGLRYSSQSWFDGKKFKAIIIRLFLLIYYPKITLPIYVRNYSNTSVCGIQVIK